MKDIIEVEHGLNQMVSGDMLNPVNLEEMMDAVTSPSYLASIGYEWSCEAIESVYPGFEFEWV